MVKVEEVNDATFEDNESDYETSSSVGSADLDDDNVSIASSSPDDEETFADRIIALKDIVSPQTRLALSDSLATTSRWVRWSGKVAGNLVWVVTTTALLIGLPMALAIEDEAKMQAQEKEMYAKQEGTAALMGPPGTPAQQAPATPPGF